jgi:hypothetical protein
MPAQKLNSKCVIFLTSMRRSVAEDLGFCHQNTSVMDRALLSCQCFKERRSADKVVELQARAILWLPIHSSEATQSRSYVAGCKGPITAL